MRENLESIGFIPSSVEMSEESKTVVLEYYVKQEYEGTEERVRWHNFSNHVSFVSEIGPVIVAREQQRRYDAGEFEAIDPDFPHLIKAVCLVHDLNYIVDPHSTAEAGFLLRQRLLLQSGYSEQQIAWIEDVILKKDPDSLAVKVFEDADNAAKFQDTNDPEAFCKEQGITKEEMAKQIITNQWHRIADDKPYFNTPYAEAEFGEKARRNLLYWREIYDATFQAQPVETLTES